MTTWYAVLIGLAAALGLAFVIMFGPPWRTESPYMAWLQACIALASLGVDSLLFAVLFHFVPPPWYIILVFAFKDAAFTWRLGALVRQRSKEGSPVINSPYAKAIAAALVTGATAGLIAVQTAIPMSQAAHGWVTVALAVLGGMGGTTAAVYQVRNMPASVKVDSP